jgi:hypothetical protein
VLTNPAERQRYDRLGHAAYCDAEGWAEGAARADTREYSDATVEERYGAGGSGSGTDGQTASTGAASHGQSGAPTDSGSSWGVGEAPDDQSTDPSEEEPEGRQFSRERVWEYEDPTTESADADADDEETSGPSGAPDAGTDGLAPGSTDVHAGASADRHWLLGSARVIGTIIAGTLLLSAVFFFLLLPSPAGPLVAAFGSSVTMIVVIGFGVLLTVTFFAAVLIEDFKI